MNPGYDPSRASIATQQAALPAQYDAQAQGLAAAAQTANDGILSAAQNRGLGFSGIPLGEEAKYNATSYMPALANLKSTQINASTSLSDQLNKLNLDQRTQASGILTTQQASDQQERQFQQTLQAQKAAAAAQSAALSSSLGSASSATPAPTGNPFAGSPQKTGTGGSYNFTNANGQGITAAAYAAQMGIGFRSLLTEMAKAGDSNAKIALNYVGDNAKFGSAPSQYQGALNALGATGSFAPAAAAPFKAAAVAPARSQSVMSNLSMPGRF